MHNLFFLIPIFHKTYENINAEQRLSSGQTRAFSKVANRHTILDRDAKTVFSEK